MTDRITAKEFLKTSVLPVSIYLILLSIVSAVVGESSQSIAWFLALLCMSFPEGFKRVRFRVISGTGFGVQEEVIEFMKGILIVCFAGLPATCGKLFRAVKCTLKVIWEGVLMVRDTLRNLSAEEKAV